MSSLNSIMDIMMNKKPKERPEGATSIYVVNWCVRSDSFDGLSARISSSSTPTKLYRSKHFVSKDKAEALRENLTKAFETLEYNLEGLVYIEESWYE